MTIIKVLKNHPEALALAGSEFALDRIETAVRMIARIGQNEHEPKACDAARRKLGAAALREAVKVLQGAAASLEAGQ